MERYFILNGCAFPFLKCEMTGVLMKIIKGLRWYMIGLVMLATVLNYLARNSLSVAAPTMMHELNITIQQYSYIDAVFKGCYTLMQPVAGFILDFLGTKTGYIIFAVAWGLLNMAHAFAGSWGSLAFLRGALGAAEAAVIPAGLKASSEWFPAKERSVAVGWFNAGAAIGGVIAPPLVAWAILAHSWNFAFLITGGVSLIWAIAWYKFYNSPDKHKNISKEELKYIKEGQEEQHQATNNKRAPVSTLLKNRQFWGIALPRFLAEPAWGTLNAWIPLFLFKVYGMDIKQIAMLAWLPMVFADVGCIVGGYLPGFFQKRFGVTLVVSRKLVVTVGALCMIGPGLIGLYSNPYFAILMLCFGGFAHQTLSGALITLSSDLFGRNEVATANGLTGMIGWGGSTIFTLVVGALVETIGFSPLFVMLTIFEMLAMTIVWTVIKEPKRKYEHLSASS